jgi:hypothetical protein
MKKEIKELIALALADNPQHYVLNIGNVPYKQAQFINQYVTEDITDLIRILDTSGIRHAIKEHGSPNTEEPRGQIAITTDDFLLVPDILKSPDSLE